MNITIKQLKAFGAVTSFSISRLPRVFVHYRKQHSDINIAVQDVVETIKHQITAPRNSSTYKPASH